MALKFDANSEHQISRDAAMPLLTRRRALAVAVTGSLGHLAGCHDPAPSWVMRHVPDWALRLLPAAPAVPPLVSKAAASAFLLRRPLPPRYRSVQRFLLQGVPERELASRVTGGEPYFWDQFGPTHRYVDAHTGWPWSRPGGDWLDAAGTRHGLVPWFSVAVAEPLGPDGVSHYFAEVTRLVQYTQEKDRWLALLLVARNTERSIAGTAAGSSGAPSIDVVYSDGQRARLRCHVVGNIDPSTSLPSTTSPSTKLPACVEFDRPDKPVRSAQLRFVVTDHWSGQQPFIDGYLLDPPLNIGMPLDGVSSQAERLDGQLEAHPDVIGVHHYLDGRSLADFVHKERANFTSENRFDPAIFDNGPEDRDLLPHAGVGKWINAGPPFSLVPSQYQGDGFAPLSPGLGALRLQMPAVPGLRDGAIVGNEGTLAGDARIFLPEPLFGRLNRLFVRYYMRLGITVPSGEPPRLHVKHREGQAAWTNLSGKFGIAPDHTTSDGGVSGTSGGNAGWQMRLAWHECDAPDGGPDTRGWAPGFHLYDFQDNNPRGHRYGREMPPQFERWGQLGGLGGVLYAGHWYCIETELKLNSTLKRAPGFLPDGELRAWVDGRLVYEQTGLVFRAGPLNRPPYQARRLRTCRELGIRGLWLNWFHGGQTVSTVDRTLFYTGLVWARRYIGPMRL